MAEKSKKRGEFGEEIVENLLKFIGWEHLLKGRDFNCVHPMAHTTSTGSRTVHGIDFIYHYECPFFNDKQEFVLVSSKFNDKYPLNPGPRFKSHLRDLAQALECFKKSSLKHDLSILGKNKSYTGVIFWLDNGKEIEYDDMVDKLGDFRVDNDLEFDSIYLVDNKRSDFLYNTITFAQNKFEGVIEFVIPNIGHNSIIPTRKTSSSILPVQYINSSILPFKVIQKDSTEILVLNIIDEFAEDSLRRLVSLAQQLTEGWGNKVYILFPRFNEDLHGEAVEKIKLEFKDQHFIRKIEVETFHQDFRNV